MRLLTWLLLQVDYGHTRSILRSSLQTNFCCTTTWLSLIPLIQLWQCARYLIPAWEVWIKCTRPPIHPPTHTNIHTYCAAASSGRVLCCVSFIAYSGFQILKQRTPFECNISTPHVLNCCTLKNPTVRLYVLACGKGYILKTGRIICNCVQHIESWSHDLKYNLSTRFVFINHAPLKLAASLN